MFPYPLIGSGVCFLSGMGSGSFRRHPMLRASRSQRKIEELQSQLAGQVEPIKDIIAEFNLESSVPGPIARKPESRSQHVLSSASGPPFLALSSARG